MGSDLGPLFVSEVACSQVGDTDNHASLGIEWKVFEIEAAVKVSYGVVERMGEDTEAADISGVSNRGSEREEEKRAAAAPTLIPTIHGKLAEQHYGDRVRAIALRRLWQICPLNLTGTQGNVGGNETACGIADDAGA
ncbi:hypothetical protein ABID26_004207 [Mesorhizobium shonense]|uniref:Uncharacterized protein n=1 Tax=Mesorhizobium shonense TaxID=1209948 RepID=A0ABV2HW23_9HYPH